MLKLNRLYEKEFQTFTYDVVANSHPHAFPTSPPIAMGGLYIHIMQETQPLLIVSHKGLLFSLRQSADHNVAHDVDRG